MQQLPDALAPLAAHDQFILWTLATKNGKPTKVPLDPTTGTPCNALDSANWMAAADAIHSAQALGAGVGFVLTPNDPYFLLDIDRCLDDSGRGWSQFALDLVAQFPGAAVEVSQSGAGLHVIGRADEMTHRCRNGQHDIELYTRDRFVAFGGREAVGCAATNLTDQLRGVVGNYFYREGGDWTSVDWTTEPHESWRGPDDDNELLRRARASKSPRAAFGEGVSFSQLFDADGDALARAYPGQGAEGAYNSSSADAALAQHLVFWTGGNCERILQLMRRSPLARAKWDRDDYLPRTIVGAVALQGANQGAYYRETRCETGPVVGQPKAQIVSGHQFLDAARQIEHFTRCVYVQDVHKVLAPSGAYLKESQFNATYGGFLFQLDAMGDKTTKRAWEAFTESQVVRYPKAEAGCFRPELEAGKIFAEEGRTLVNTYVPIQTASAAGDVGPFTTHLEKLLPHAGDREILLAYMAACVQHVGVKFQWAPLLQGAEGNGKTLLTRCVAAAVGHTYSHYPNASDIDNKFNAWVERKLFIGVEDIYVPDNKRAVLEALKPLITNDRIDVQAKGSDQVTRDNRANFMLNSNHRDALRKTRSDRRFCVFFTAQQSADDILSAGMGGKYFPTLYAWLKSGGYAHVTHYLQTYAIPNELNPATDCHRAPATSSTDAAVEASLGGVEQEIIEAVESGRVGFCGGWVSSNALHKLLQELRYDRLMPPNKRTELMTTLGYELHPGLPGGRVNNTILIDGGKPRLYIKCGHLACNLRVSNEISRVYQEAQGAITEKISTAC